MVRDSMKAFRNSFLLIVYSFEIESGKSDDEEDEEEEDDEEDDEERVRKDNVNPTSIPLANGESAIVRSFIILFLLIKQIESNFNSVMRSICRMLTNNFSTNSLIQFI